MGKTTRRSGIGRIGRRGRREGRKVRSGLRGSRKGREARKERWRHKGVVEACELRNVGGREGKSRKKAGDVRGAGREAGDVTDGTSNLSCFAESLHRAGSVNRVETTQWKEQTNL
jgi:hypothetical protein